MDGLEIFTVLVISLIIIMMFKENTTYVPRNRHNLGPGGTYNPQSHHGSGSHPHHGSGSHPHHGSGSHPKPHVQKHSKHHSPHNLEPNGKHHSYEGFNMSNRSFATY